MLGTGLPGSTNAFAASASAPPATSHAQDCLYRPPFELRSLIAIPPGAPFNGRTDPLPPPTSGASAPPQLGGIAGVREDRDPAGGALRSVTVEIRLPDAQRAGAADPTAPLVTYKVTLKGPQAETFMRDLKQTLGPPLGNLAAFQHTHTQNLAMKVVLAEAMANQLGVANFAGMRMSATDGVQFFEHGNAHPARQFTMADASNLQLPIHDPAAPAARPSQYVKFLDEWAKCSGHGTGGGGVGSDDDSAVIVVRRPSVSSSTGSVTVVRRSVSAPTGGGDDDTFVVGRRESRDSREFDLTDPARRATFSGPFRAGHDVPAGLSATSRSSVHARARQPSGRDDGSGEADSDVSLGRSRSLSAAFASRASIASRTASSTVGDGEQPWDEPRPNVRDGGGGRDRDGATAARRMSSSSSQLSAAAATASAPRSVDAASASAAPNPVAADLGAIDARIAQLAKRTALVRSPAAAAVGSASALAQPHGDPDHAADFEALQERDRARSANLILGRQANMAPGSQDAVRSARDRYLNIRPIEGTRVQLAVPSDAPPGSDYINANFVNGPISGRRYIAAQGPIDVTKDHFHQMLVEQRVQHVWMVTQQFEGLTKQGKPNEKCANYWDPPPAPAAAAAATSDAAAAAVPAGAPISAEGAPVVERTFDAVTRDQRGHETGRASVNQHQYTAWPDHGVPGTVKTLSADANAAHVQALMHEAVAISRLPPDPPVVIHCSAGIGRTGVTMGLAEAATFFDAKLRGLASGPEFTQAVMDGWITEIVGVMPGMVDTMRDGRAGLVQTQVQYEFLTNRANLQVLLDTVMTVRHPNVTMSTQL